MDGNASFGHWVRLRRKALRLSCAELARRVGCATITLRKIEADERRPSEQIAARLAEHLDVGSHERQTFLKVARGQLGVTRLALPDPIADRPALAPSAPLHTTVPSPPTPLIGRTADVAAVRKMLLRSDVRLLTLIGAPGIGKTRLAMEVALELHEVFVNGVAFVPLAPVRDPDLVLPTIAQALEISEVPGQPLLERLQTALREKHMLLVLDNFEQVLKAARHLGELLAAAPQLTLLITSRVALHLSGEHRFAVPPLALPDVQRLTSDAQLAVTLVRYAAIELFVQRACAALPTFTLTDTNVLTVAAICRRLDGLPLAIELAAARVALFTPSELLERLDQRLALLTTGAVDLPTRQQTLRRAIDWSYELLDEGEQKLFRRLAVFVGGCTLEAAMAVCDTTDDLEIDVLEGVTALLDKSLLQREEGADGRSRFTMLETIREYALERLAASGEAEMLRQQHAAYLLVLAERADTEFSGSEQVVWLARMRAEHANHRAALEWAVEHGAIETAVRLATMWWWGRDPAPITEARRWLEKLLRQSGSLPISLRAQVLMMMGDFASMQDDYPRAQALLEESLLLSRTIGDEDRIATILRMLGKVAIGRGDHRQALEFLTESRALFLKLEDTLNLAMSLLGLGVVLSLEGDYAQAMALCTESLALAQECGNILLTAWTFKHLGNLAQRQGDAGQARAWLANSLALFQDAGEMVGIMAYLEGMAEVAGLEGEPERLVRLFGAASPLHARFGVSPYPAEQAAYEQQLLAARGFVA